MTMLPAAPRPVDLYRQALVWRACWKAMPHATGQEIAEAAARAMKGLR